MSLTNFPDGISLTTATGVSEAGGIKGTTGSFTGTITGSNGSVYGSKVVWACFGTAGPAHIASLSSALFVTAATVEIVAPFDAVAEIIWVTGGTANIAATIRITETSVSTGNAVVTLAITSDVYAASSVFTTIGATTLTRGSDYCVTSAVQATANTSQLMVNLIPIE